MHMRVRHIFYSYTTLQKHTTCTVKASTHAPLAVSVIVYAIFKKTPGPAKHRNQCHIRSGHQETGYRSTEMSSEIHTTAEMHTVIYVGIQATTVLYDVSS